MRPTDEEPAQEELETLLDDEDRTLLDEAEVPDEVKTEIATRLETFREDDLDATRGDGAGP